MGEILKGMKWMPYIRVTRAPFSDDWKNDERIDRAAQ
jgi:hypothetical protein